GDLRAGPGAGGGGARPAGRSARGGDDDAGGHPRDGLRPPGRRPGLLPRRRPGGGGGDAGAGARGSAAAPHQGVPRPAAQLSRAGSRRPRRHTIQTLRARGPPAPVLVMTPRHDGSPCGEVSTLFAKRSKDAAAWSTASGLSLISKAPHVFGPAETIASTSLPLASRHEVTWAPSGWL